MKVLLVNPDYEIERYMGRHFGRMGWVMGGYREDELFYVPQGRGSEELKKLQRRANFGFYFRPRIMAGFIRRIRSLDEVGEYARGAWGLVKATVSPY